MIRITLLVITLLIAGLYITAPSESDIAACVQSSNYTADQCRFEMSK